MQLRLTEPAAFQYIQQLGVAHFTTEYLSACIICGRSLISRKAGAPRFGSSQIGFYINKNQLQSISHNRMYRGACNEVVITSAPAGKTES